MRRVETIPTRYVQDSTAYKLPSTQRTIAVELLKALLAEVMMSAVQVGRAGNDGIVQSGARQ